MSAGTVLGFDFGTKRIGVAVAEMETRVAHPIAVINGEEARQRFAAIAKLVQEWQPGRLVVGLPLDKEGGEQEVTHRARRFARQLEGRHALPVSLVDERYTTMDAERGMRASGGARAVKSGKADAAAAQLILQQWLDEVNRE